MSDYSHMSQWLNDVCQQWAERNAFHCSGQTLEYSELYYQSRLFACWLNSLPNAQQGRRVAVILPNMLQYPLVVYGAWLADHTVVNINPLSTPRELKRILIDSGADIVVYLDLFAEPLFKAVQDLSITRFVKVQIADMQSNMRYWLIRLATFYKIQSDDRQLKNITLLENIIAKELNCEKIFVHDDPEAIALIQYTMGTTGVQKGACLTHKNLLANLDQVSAWMATQPIAQCEPIKAIAPLPLYHIYSFSAHLIVLFHHGAQSYLITDPTKTDAIVMLFQQFKINAISGIDRLFKKLLQNPKFKRCDFSLLALTLSGGAPLSPETAKNWQQLTHSKIQQGYGMTEASPVIAIADVSSPSGSVGNVVKGTSIEVRNNRNELVTQGEIGEFYIQGPQVFQHYWQSPETSKDAFFEQWFKTGDMGYLDENNNLFVVDRKKDLIIVSGFNVYPNEIENVVASFPGVLQCAAIGVPSDKTGEAIKLFYVTTELINEKKLEAFCRNQLSGYKIPKVWQRVDELPASSIGKILRRKLKQKSEAEL